MSGPGSRGGGGGGGPMPPRQGGGMSNAVSSQSGISKTSAAGINYSDNWGDKVSVQGSYFFNKTNNNLTDSLNRAYFDTISGQRDYYQLSDKVTDNYSHRFNMRLTYKPTENDEIMFMPNLSYQKTDSESYSLSETTLDGVLQNSSETKSASESNGYNMSAELLWRHKFAKEGRTISFMANGALSKNESSSDQNILLNDETTIQVVDNNSDGYRFGGNMVYTEPISHNQQLSASYNVNLTNSTSDKVTTEDNDGVLSVDKYLSNDYVSDYMTQSAGLGYRINGEKVRLMANLNYQRADLKGEQNFPYYSELSYTTDKSYYSFLPMVMLDYNPSQNKSVRVTYRSSSSAPSVTQLQSTIDNSNPLQLYQGDPNLDQTITHDLSVRFISSNVEKATNWMAYVSATKKFDYIGSDITIVNEDTPIDENVTLAKGGQITRPVNLDDYLNLRSNLTYGFPVDFLMSNLNISAGVNYSETPGIQNGQNLLTKSLSLVPGASLTSNISSKLDFSLSYNADFNKVKSNLANSGNYDYLTHTGNAKLSWVIWKGIILENNLNWKCYTGSSMDEKEQFFIWNASLGKKFLKNNRAELKISAYDLLEQNRSFSRTIADAYTQTSYSNVLGRYFMVTFTYNIQNYRGAKKS